MNCKQNELGQLLQKLSSECTQATAMLNLDDTFPELKTVVDNMHQLFQQIRKACEGSFTAVA
ncbi:MAG: hypothetical protein ABW007_09535 [Chitinophagaceae bacterium]